MAAGIVTTPGRIETRTFYANVRRPQLPPPPKNAPGGSEVHMFLAGEAEARCWDEKLTIELNGSRPCLGAMEIVKDDTVPTIFVAGDSTVGDPRRGPGGNWPTQICQAGNSTPSIEERRQIEILQINDKNHDKQPSGISNLKAQIPPLQLS